jgi:spore coat protein U-like protein
VSAALIMTRLCTLCLLAGLAVFSGAAAAASGGVTVTGTVLSKNHCKFSAGSVALAFGSVDPSSASPAAASATITVTCIGSDPLASFSVTRDNGLYSPGAGVIRMRHATMLTQFLPYTLSVSPTSATIPKGGSQAITISGAIAPSDASNAYVGSYADTVVLTVVP